MNSDQPVLATPLKSIRHKCLDCAGGWLEVKKCDFTECSLHPYRFGKNPFRGKSKPADYRPPLKTVRAECLNCSGSTREVKLCPATGCALHPYRFGKNPYPSEARRKLGLKLALLARLKRIEVKPYS